MLESAGEEGLDPADYGARTFSGALAPAQAPQLSAAVQRYLEDLAVGRVDPRAVGAAYAPAEAVRASIPARLDAVASAADLDALVAALRPRVPAYARLREALPGYRALVGHPAWGTALPPLPGDKLVRGSRWSGLPLLSERLAALGDLRDADHREVDTYDAELQAAVTAFQARHGLEPDGIVGRATLAQLEVTPAARVRQIELTMERLRWTPLLQGRRMIAVNIPEFALWAYETQAGAVHRRLRMRVVVGRALDTGTPLMVETMQRVEFAPYWNVPASIARDELVPRLRRDPGHLAREGFEFVEAGGRVRTALTPALLDAVLAGKARLRQRPGPRNAVGAIKFVLPNDESIYLHHTDATGLFARARRDFSHGCIRVEDPVALAQFVLQDDPAWTRARILAAMAAGRETSVPLPAPVGVVIAYGTALVREGRVHFFPDIYGHDRVLERTLQARSRQGQSAGLPGTAAGR